MENMKKNSMVLDLNYIYMNLWLNAHTYTNIHIYTYMFTYLCKSVCMYVCVNNSVRWK